MKNLKRLRKLSIWKYKPKEKNLEELISLTKLEELKIIQGNLNSLKGSHAFSKLTKLEVNDLRNLEYIDEVEKNSTTLKWIEFDNCSKIKNHSYVSCLRELETLIFARCGDIQNLKFIKEIPKLKHLSFIDSNIVDGDIEPCIGIDFVGFNNKRHYSYKFEELNPELAKHLSFFK
ncbi:hypothetical protein [Bacillus sp. 165]|uniref:hypothetical protein n=1 Tax=Bacillus sp. 165 TaxID=1529117 RepID=UPI001FFE00D9|nr:hypothetical protein [Bacillus sp. 165]